MGEPSIQDRVLIVEDDSALNHLFTQVLQRVGRDVRGVYTIAQAKSFLDVLNPPDLIILDLNLPDGDGTEVLQILQAGRFDKTKVIILSSAAGKRMNELVSYGVAEILMKPVRPMALASLVNTTILPPDDNIQ